MYKIKDTVLKFVLFFVINLFYLDSFSQVDKTDSLVDILTRVNGLEKVDILNRISETYTKTDSAKCLFYANEALAMANKQNYEIGIAESYLRIAELYFWIENSGHYSSNTLSDKYYTILYKKSKTINYNKGLAYYYFYKAAISWKNNDYSNTLKNYFKSNTYFKKEKNHRKLAINYNNIADVFFKNNEFNKSIKYYNKCIEIEPNNNFSVSLAQLGIGLALYNLAKYDSAKLILNKALLTNNKLIKNNYYKPIYKLHILNALAEVCLSQKHINEAKTFLIRADSLSVEFISTDTKYWFSELFLLSNDLQKAEDYALISLQMAENDYSKWPVYVDKLARSYKLLARITYKKNEFQQAYFYLTLYTNYKDSAFSIQQSQNISKISQNYENQLKTKEINLLKISRENNKLEINVLYLSLIYLFLILVLILYISYNYYRKQQINELFLTKEFEMQQKLKIKELENINNKSRITELKLQNASVSIINNKNELIVNAAHILNLNQNLGRLLTKIKELKPYLNKEGQTKLFDLVKEVRLNEQNENWNDFKHKFDLLHTSFYKEIQRIIPSLTNNEKKICALLTIDMSINEIAVMLNKTYNSTNVAVSRIRQKFQISTSPELIEKLKSIESKSKS